MKLYCILNRSFLAALLLLTVLIALICGEFLTYASKEDNGGTHQNRITFIEGLGYMVDENSVLIKEIKIPNAFSDVYENYNSLQLSAGYDLKPYCGCEAVKYTYKLTDCTDSGLTQINLLVCDGEIIGGDVSSVQLGGAMLPLIKKQ